MARHDKNPLMVSDEEIGALIREVRAKHGQRWASVKATVLRRIHEHAANMRVQPGHAVLAMVQRAPTPFAAATVLAAFLEGKTDATIPGAN